MTGQYLSGKKLIAVPKIRRKGSGKSLFVFGASEHNLKGIDVEIPLGKFVAITGVSGSGKGTLVHEILYAALKKMKGEYTDPVGQHKSIEGAEHIDDVELVDQTPIGRTPRSNPITYIKAFDTIHNIFSETPAAKISKHISRDNYSFNIPGGNVKRPRGAVYKPLKCNSLPTWN